MRRGALLLLFELAPLELSLNLLLQVESGGQNLASLPVRVGVHSEEFLQKLVLFKGGINDLVYRRAGNAEAPPS